MKKNLNKKGFAMVETIVSALAIAFTITMLYNIIYPISAKNKATENYEDLDTKYLAYYIKEMIETDTSTPNRITNMSGGFQSDCGNTCKMYETTSYKCATSDCKADNDGNIMYVPIENNNIFTTDYHYTNRNSLCNMLDTSKKTKNNMYYCNQFVNASHITNIYITSYETTSVPTGASRSFKDFVKNSNMFTRSFKSYVAYLPSHISAANKNRKLLLIVEQEHEALTEFGDKYYTYASIEVNRE